MSNHFASWKILKEKKIFGWKTGEKIFLLSRMSVSKKRLARFFCNSKTFCQLKALMIGKWFSIANLKLPTSFIDLFYRSTNEINENIHNNGKKQRREIDTKQQQQWAHTRLLWGKLLINFFANCFLIQKNRLRLWIKLEFHSVFLFHRFVSHTKSIEMQSGGKRRQK